jgi:spore coat polysaccharide biosynthesis protein SpsF (cytidylyltransferase family)
MQIGGWSDYQTMRKIYTHISQKDADSYKNAMSEFYNKKADNANNNAN